jgi:hypothetical protein
MLNDWYFKYVTTLYQLLTLYRIEKRRKTVNRERAVEAHFKILSRHSSGASKGNHKSTRQLPQE